MTPANWALPACMATALLLGCAAPPLESVGTWHDTVIAGEVDDNEADAAVIVVKSRYDEPATGVLVAPTLVLSARQLVVTAGPQKKDRFFLQCAEDQRGLPVGQPIEHANDPANYFVGTGSEFSQVVRFFAGAELDLCGNDMVLLQLESAVRKIAPLPLRLDEPPRVGERGWLVGWGMTELSDDVMEGQGLVISDERRRRAIDVRAVGKTEFETKSGTLAVPAGMFLAPPSGCYGDIGGPFIAESGAVIGILSGITPPPPDEKTELETVRDCRLQPTFFRSLAAQSAWLRDAFHHAGEVPWLEGLARPGALGEACSDDRECRSGSCLSAAGGRAFCTSSCELEACPGGFECLGEEGRRWCLPARLHVDAFTSQGCATARLPPGGTLCASLLAGAALAVLGWRRGRASTALGKMKEKP
jgi:hypothetical protein